MRSIPGPRSGEVSAHLSIASSREDKVWWEPPAAHFLLGSSMRPEHRGTCRGERFVLGEHVPDGFGELAGDVDPGHLGAALAAEPRGGALVAVAIAGCRAAWVAASMSAQRRYLGPFLASGPRWSLLPDWRTSGHSPVYPASFLGLAKRPMSPISEAIV